MLITIRSALLIGIALKLRENWRKKVEPLSAPLRYAGFTLIELSIVLVIIGLIVGGVLVGQDLVDTAKDRKLISGFQEFYVAMNTFRLKYNALPGDFKFASSFWGSCVDHSMNPCNGNGNRIIEAFPSYEDIRVWQHLSLSGLIGGEYDGSQTFASSSDMTYPKINGLTTKIETAYTDRDENLFANKIMFGASLEGEYLLETRVHRMDQKHDDGIAKTGKFGIRLGDPAADCLMPGSDDYDLTDSAGREDCFVFYEYR